MGHERAATSACWCALLQVRDGEACTNNCGVAHWALEEAALGSRPCRRQRLTVPSNQLGLYAAALPYKDGEGGVGLLQLRIAAEQEVPA